MSIRSLLRRRVATTIALCGLAAPLPAIAQSTSGTRHDQAGRGFFQVGYMGLDLGDLNATLVAAGLPKLDDQYLTIGGAGFGEIGRFLIGGEGAGLIGQHRTTSNGSYDVSLDGGFGMFRIGYNVVAHRGFDLYPTLGIGGAGMQLEIRGRSAPTFGEVIADPARSSRMSSGGFLLGVGIDGNFRIAFGEKPTGERGGMVVGLSTGYMFQPYSSDWTLDGLNSVAGGPTVKVEGFYLRLSIGGWGRKPAVP